MSKCVNDYFCLVVTLSFALSLSGQVDSNQKKTDVDPAAMAALEKMGAFLRTLTVFQVKAAQTRDDVWDNGQAIQSSHVIDLLAARPNRLRAQIKSDDTDAFFLYNGKDFTVYGHLVNYYATVPAPPTIRTDRKDGRKVWHGHAACRLVHVGFTPISRCPGNHERY